ncbi:hypothetical protein ACJIZ3_021905 [Penstemon smallii]|uniref:Carbohydrate-binding-like fold protein n=1 Tax=Penstemon smallii TaxID=265156 RepID=A0ABD3SMS3_9LAMI
MISACYYFLVVTLLLYVSPLSAADSIQGCGGSVEASSTLIKSRKSSDAKFDYSHITVELRTLDGLVKDRTQCAPNGYYFIPVYDKGSFLIKIKGPTGWSYTPEQAPVVVDHTGCNANEDINFRFTGFTLSGRVVGAVGGDSCSHKNGGPSDVNVELLSPSGDVVSSVSTTSGSYSFINIIPGKYKIRASRSDLNIEIKGSGEVELGFDNGVVDDIFFASGYDIRGSVVAQVPPGDYRMSALAATPETESAPELLFSPAYINVIVNKPLLSIKFNQAQVNIRGLVVCKRRCGSSVSVMLVRLNGKSKEERRKINLTNLSSEFFFSNVLPGKYRVEVKSYSPYVKSGEDIWCWEQSFVNVDVGAEDVEGIAFIQKGIWVRVISNYDADAYLKVANGSLVNLTIKKGSQHICIESGGYHELLFVDPCRYSYFFVQHDSYHPSPVVLPEKYPRKGHIIINVESNKNLPEDITLDILGSEGTVIGDTVAFPVYPGIDRQSLFCLHYCERTPLISPARYEYCVGVKIGEKLILVPRDPRNDGGKKILFYPRQQHAYVAKKGRPVLIAPFSGRLGLYIEGSVSPPLSHVHIRVLAEKDSQNSLLKQGDVALETTTGTDGLFLAGPLYDDIGYTVEASKPGYYVKQVGLYSFSCQKLGQILVRLYFGEDSNEPSPSVLLSLSGEDGYRNKSVTGVSGTFVFDSLIPGSFYLRPLLKEYAFSPPAEAIDLGSGESKKVAFHATRIAFSALGKVTLFSGQPKEGVSVEARAESNGFYEETVTDSSGSYRLRGLQPNTDYVIKIARKSELDSSLVERASPELLTVKVGYEDMKELDFVVYEQPELTILSGQVEGKNIEEANDPSKVESIFPLPISNFFQADYLPKGKHLVQLRAASHSIAQRFESEVIKVDLERQP